MQGDTSGEELIVIDKIKGLYLLYYERGFKHRVRQMQGLGI
jgi:hypothetical protein